MVLPAMHRIVGRAYFIAPFADGLAALGLLGALPRSSP